MTKQNNRPAPRVLKTRALTMALIAIAPISPAVASRDTVQDAQLQKTRGYQ